MRLIFGCFGLLLITSCYNLQVVPPIQVNGFDKAGQGRIGFAYATSGIATGQAAFSISDHYALEASGSFSPQKYTPQFRNDLTAFEFAIERFSTFEGTAWSITLGGGLGDVSIADSGTSNGFTDGGLPQFVRYDARYAKIFAGIQDGEREDSYEIGGGAQIFYLNYFKFHTDSRYIDSAANARNGETSSITSPQRGFGIEPFFYYKLKGDGVLGFRMAILTELVCPYVFGTSELAAQPFVSVGLHLAF